MVVAHFYTVTIKILAMSLSSHQRLPHKYICSSFLETSQQRPGIASTTVVAEAGPRVSFFAMAAMLSVCGHLTGHQKDCVLNFEKHANCSNMQDCPRNREWWQLFALWLLKVRLVRVLTHMSRQKNTLWGMKQIICKNDEVWHKWCHILIAEHFATWVTESKLESSYILGICYFWTSSQSNSFSMLCL